jgi:hypothetical protein
LTQKRAINVISAVASENCGTEIRAGNEPTTKDNSLYSVWEAVMNIIKSEEIHHCCSRGFFVTVDYIPFSHLLLPSLLSPTAALR